MDKQISGSLMEIQMICALLRYGELTQKDLEEHIGATRAWVSKHQDRIRSYGFIAVDVRRSGLSPNFAVMHYRITDRHRARAYVRRQAKQFCWRYSLDEAVMPRLLEAGRLSERESRAISTAIDKVLAKR